MDATQSQALVDIQNLRRTLGDKDVLRDISLRLEPGCTLGLIGRTGAGKTTLLSCMLGLSFPDAGTANLFGETATELSAQAKARLGYVPQTPNLPGEHTVNGLIRVIASWQPNWDSQWANELLLRFTLAGDVRVRSLSVGQQQLLAMVLALGHKPELLILDEPVSSLDPVTRRIVAATLAELQAERGMSIVFSTHIMSDLERLATHIAVIEEGQIGLLCEADEIRSDICKWHIHSRNGALPERLPNEGVLRYRKTSASTAIALVDQRSGLLQTSLPYEITAHTLSLEDFVVEYLQ